MAYTDCECCCGTGDMPTEQARNIFEETGERPNQRYGCTECDGTGGVEVEE